MQIMFVHAGEHRHRQKLQRSALRRFHCSVQHGASTRSVDRKHAGPQFRSFAHRSRNRVGNVMILKIEKYLLTHGCDFFDRAWPLRGEQLHANFVNGSRVANRVHDLSRSSQRRDIQSYNQALPWISHPREFKRIVTVRRVSNCAARRWFEAPALRPAVRAADPAL